MLSPRLQELPSAPIVCCLGNGMEFEFTAILIVFRPHLNRFGFSEGAFTMLKHSMQ